MGVLFLLFFVLVAHASSSAYKTQTPGGSRLLILFLDGLRYDYFQHLDEAGGIGQIRAQGCHVPRVTPVFPSNCFSNVHAIFAGHNSTHFNAFNTSLEANYTHSDLLWYRAAEMGKSVKLVHFPFCPSLNVRGVDCIPHADPIAPSLNSTLSDALQSITNSSSDLTVVYYGELDRLGHAYGPYPETMLSVIIQTIDMAISQVVEFIKSNPNENVNFAIVSDHGMTKFKAPITLERAFKWFHLKNLVNLGSVVGIWPKPAAKDDLSAALSKERIFRNYTPETLPVVAWQSSELPPIILVADPGYVFEVHHHPPVSWDHFYPERMLPQLQGVHGYLPNVSDMQTTFFAYGPAFMPGCMPMNKTVYTYDIYPLLRNALLPNSLPLDPSGDGDDDNDDEPAPGWEVKVVMGVLFAVFAVILIFGLALRRLLKIKQHPVDRICLTDDFDEAEYREYKMESLPV
ncbi:hypothetical protein Aperf_G00000063627 [Anoplocephala perfoliata]